MHPEHRSIGELAYLLWQARGCPQGTAEKDWLDAEKQLGEALATRLRDEASALPNQSRPLSEQAPAKSSSGKRPSRARAAQSNSASSKPASSKSASKPANDAAR